MKKILFFLCTAFILVGYCYAESLYPNELVLTMIKSAKNSDINNLMKVADLKRIANLPRHGINQEKLINLLSTIDMNKIKFQQKTTSQWRMHKTVRMIAPLSIDFDFELISANDDNQEDNYIIVGVHP